MGKNEPTPTQEPVREEAMDATIRPGGVFMVQLLMKDQAPLPPKERMQEVLQAHVGAVEPVRGETAALFAVLDHSAQFKEGPMPVQLSILGCEPFQGRNIPEERLAQMWDCQGERDRLLEECRYAVLAHDLLGGGLPSQTRANLLMDYLEALLELYPSCEAVYFLNSGKLLLAQDIRNSPITGLDRYVNFAMNARFFNITGTQDHIVDTLGLSLLYIEDLQYHFHDMDPNWVVHHAYSLASYLLNNDRPMEDGDSIDGIADGQLVQEIQWPCHFENALVAPERPVLDVCMGEYAAGGR